MCSHTGILFSLVYIKSIVFAVLMYYTDGTI